MSPEEKERVFAILRGLKLGGKVLVKGRERWPSQLLSKAKKFRDKIIRRKKFAASQLSWELGMSYQVIGQHPVEEASDLAAVPLFTLQSIFFVDNSNKQIDHRGFSENRTTLTLRQPYVFDIADNFNLGVELRASLAESTDLISGGTQNSAYLGLTVQPLPWLRLSFDERLGTLRFNSPDDFVLKYSTDADTILGLEMRSPVDVPFVRGLSGSFRASLFHKHPELDSYYVGLRYGLGRDVPYPAAQLAAVNLSFNKFSFPYRGQTPERSRGQALLEYGYPVKELDLDDHSWWFYDSVSLLFRAGMFYESAIDPRFDGRREIRDKKDNLGIVLGLSAGLTFDFLRITFNYTTEILIPDVRQDYILEDRGPFATHRFDLQLGIGF
ncbi:MAG: hypothetical protein ABH823_03920 [bacterium]